MSAKTSWFVNSYNELVQKYGGKWILIINNKVHFADDSFEKVFKEYEKVRGQPNTEMVLIDNGEASFYAIESIIK
jgi:hypothetical protein